MNFVYKTNGTCSHEIKFEIKDGIISNVSFLGGCNGNLKAISKLVEGMSAEDIAAKLKGNTCGFRPTSCADQLAIAVLQAAKKERQ